jgi:hypothetical protein
VGCVHIRTFQHRTVRAALYANPEVFQGYTHLWTRVFSGQTRCESLVWACGFPVPGTREVKTGRIVFVCTSEWTSFPNRVGSGTLYQQLSVSETEVVGYDPSSGQFAPLHHRCMQHGASSCEELEPLHKQGPQKAGCIFKASP